MNAFRFVTLEHWEARRVNMNVIETEIGGVKIIEPDVFGDERGWFCVTYHAERYCKAGIEDLDRI